MRPRVEIYGEPLLLVAALAATAHAVVTWWYYAAPDFESIFVSARALRTGADPYAAANLLHALPNNNPPLVVALLVPFALIPFRAAATAWLTVSLLSICGTAVWIARRGSRIVPWTWLVVVVLAAEGGALALAAHDGASVAGTAEIAAHSKAAVPTG